jgi:hypothetical protein
MASRPMRFTSHDIQLIHPGLGKRESPPAYTEIASRKIEATLVRANGCETGLEGSVATNC